MKITKSNYNELRTQELDNNFAKVWHVNEMCGDTSNLQSKFTTDFVTQPTSSTTPVTINAEAGIIELGSVYSAGTLSFTVNNNKVTSSSIILLTVQTPNSQAFPWGLATSNIQNGSFEIKFYITPSATPLIYKFHFLIINP